MCSHRNWQGTITSLRLDINELAVIAETVSLKFIDLEFKETDTLIIEKPTYELGFKMSPSFNVYPNPTSNILKLEGSELQFFNVIEVYTILGRKLVHKQLEHSYELTLDVSGLGEGTYLLVLQSSTYEKVIKKFLVRRI
jgi:hypothetical protein